MIVNVTREEATLHLDELVMTDFGAAGIEIKTIHRIAVDTPTVAVEFINDTAFFVLAEESILLVSPHGVEQIYKLHRGAILSSAVSTNRLLTSGDDGQIYSTGANGTSKTLVADPRGRWIDSIAAGQDGRFAWSVGKQVTCHAADGAVTAIQVPSSVGGLSFAPNDSTLAIAHYNGATIWQPQGAAAPIELVCKGSHVQPSFSRDGNVLVTTMREPSLNAWTLADRKELPMLSFPRRVRSIDWTSDGRFLAASGSDRLVLLSFQVTDNPLARMPLLLAPYNSFVEAVACHPLTSVAAVGYADGLVLLVRIPDGAEIIIKTPDSSPIVALRWSRSGKRLGIASENGQCRVVVIG